MRNLKKHILFLCTFVCTIFNLSAFSNGLGSVNGFIENKGQILDQKRRSNNDVVYLYNGTNMNVQLRQTGFSYELFSVNNLPPATKGITVHDVSELAKIKLNSYRVDVEFKSGNTPTEIITGQKQETYLNYFVDGSQITNVPSFRKITYKNVYPAIDIEFTVEESGFKYNIILNPGADLNDVKLIYNGASSIIKTSNNSFSIKTPLGQISESIPFSYYSDTPSQHHSVNFMLENNVVTFSANYDRTKTFVIDPTSGRIWGTYFGGSSLEYCTGNGVDNLNNLYISGYCMSTSNIATGGTYQNVFAGIMDAYIAKFNSAGTLVWGTYWGGSDVDVIYNMCVTPSGTVYVCGATISTSSLATTGAHQTTYGGGINDGSLAKFSASGQIAWASYYGGNMHDICSAITVDNAGNVLITGHSESTGNIATAGTYNNVYGLNYDAFIAKFNSAGVRQWGTYYGDTNVDEGWGIGCDASNNIYITGFTASLFGISTGSAHQTINGGGQDAFIAKFDPAGVNLLWGTYYGGTGTDQGYALQVAPNGSVYVGGNTTSNTNIASAAGHQTVIGSADDGFLACFNLNGVRQWGTYYGGNDVDYVMDLFVDAKNNVLFCGQTLSTNSISTSGAFQPTIATVNLYDGYFGKFSPTGKLKLASYYGGDNSDVANAIAVDNNGHVYLTGETSSTVGISTNGSYQQTYAGGGDAFTAKLCVTAEPSVSPATFTACAGNNYTLTCSGTYTSYTWSNGFTVNPMVVPGTTFTATYYYTVAVTDVYGCDGYSDTAKVIVSTCTGGIEDMVLENNGLMVYPVPANDQIFVELMNNHDPFTIQIYSVIGELILTEQIISERKSIDINGLASGMYFLRAVQKEKVFESKMLKD